MVPWARLSANPKQHLDQFSHFCRDHQCVQQQRERDRPRNTDHILCYAVTRPNNDNNKGSALLRLHKFPAFSPISSVTCLCEQLAFLFINTCYQQTDTISVLMVLYTGTSTTTTTLHPFNGLFSRTTWATDTRIEKPVWI